MMAWDDCTSSRKLAVVALMMGGFVVFDCGNDTNSPNRLGSGGAGGGGSSSNACLAYCAAYVTDCSASDDCQVYCNTALQQANADCQDELSAYYECARSGPFRCDAALGLTPLNCGLDAYVSCEANARPSCTRAQTYDAVCASRQAGLIGYLCSVAQAPAGCVQTNPDNDAGQQSMCCPVADAGT